MSSSSHRHCCRIRAPEARTCGMGHIGALSGGRACCRIQRKEASALPLRRRSKSDTSLSCESTGRCNLHRCRCRVSSSCLVPAVIFPEQPRSRYAVSSPLRRPPRLSLFFAEAGFPEPLFAKRSIDGRKMMSNRFNTALECAGQCGVDPGDYPDPLARHTSHLPELMIDLEVRSPP